MTATRQYELIYIVAPDTTEEGVADLHKQVEGDRLAVRRRDREVGKLGPPEAGLRDRSAQRGYVRAGADQRTG